jgi:hypothetical protein
VLYILSSHVSHVIGKPVFLFKHINSTIFCPNSWKGPFLRSQKDFQVEFAFISFCFCCFHLHTFTSVTLNFLAAQQISVFLVQLMTISLNLVSFRTQVGLVEIFCTWPDILME